LPKGLADTLASQSCVRVPVGLSHELAAVLVAEVEGDIASVEVEHVPGVPTEVVPRRGVEVDLAEPASRTLV
jgi:hypothetical protein